MKSELTEKEDTEVSIKVEIGSEKVDEKIDEIYQKTVQEIDIPGFRKGKVPKGFLKARFGEDVFDEDAQQELINEHLPEALEKEGIEPVSEPEVDVENFGEGEDFIFTATVEIMPDVELGAYKGVEVQEEEVEEVTEEEMEEELERMKESNGQIEPKEEEVVEDGDKVTVENRNGNEGRVTARDKESSPMQKLIGKEVGEEAHLELDNREEESTEFRIKDVKRVVYPDLDDDFAADQGYEDMEELRKEVKSDLWEKKQEQKENELKDKVLEDVIENSKVSPPEKMVDRMVEERMDQTKNQLGEGQFASMLQQQDKNEKEFREEIEDSVREELKQNLVLDKVAEEEEIELSDEEFEKKLEKEAEKQDTSPIKFKNQLKARDSLDSFRDQLKREKVLEFLLTEANIESEEGNHE